MTQTVSFSSDSIDERTQLFTVDGDCDLSTAVEAEQRIHAALDAGSTEIIFDLRGLSSLGFEGITMLFRGQARTKMRSGRFILIRPNAYVWALFERSGLDNSFSTFRDLNHALAKTARVAVVAGQTQSR
jgi:anti-anti-sigma factor